MSDKKFIKIFDEQTADAIASGGFSYMTEKINENQAVYVFEESQEVYDILEALTESGEFQDLTYVVDESLCF